MDLRQHLPPKTNDQNLPNNETPDVGRHLPTGVVAVLPQGEEGLPLADGRRLLVDGHPLVAAHLHPAGGHHLAGKGGLVYAGPMRKARYVTMLQPVEEKYGRFVVFLVYLASLCGDVFWTASILNALGGLLQFLAWHWKEEPSF